MKRNKLSHKKAEVISSARKSNTTNPFIIYDFFDQVKKVGHDPEDTLTKTGYLEMCLRIFCPVLCICIVLLIAIKYSFTV